MAITISRTLGPAAFGLWLGTGALACTAADGDDGGGGTTEALTCEHGTVSECACFDGSMGTQTCAHDSSGFEPCVCGGEDGSSGGSNSSGTGSSSGPSTDPSTGDGDPSTSDGVDASTSSGASMSTEATGPIGAPPMAEITHPGDGEERVAGLPIPFIGAASDPEDGALSGASLVWTDDIEGELGQGEQLDAALLGLGDHVVTLTATDADGNIGEASISLVIVAP